MKPMKRNLYIIAGCNGAGKTTASFTLLPDVLDCREFVNADEIARGLSPFQPQTTAVEAGKIMLRRMDELLRAGESFAFETTLAAKTYQSLVRQAKKQGYYVTLMFFWLETVELARQRVHERVLKGGHDIPADVIRRRYHSGIKNLFSLYAPIVDEAFIYDNSQGKQELIAKKIGNAEWLIQDDSKFNQLKDGRE
jgi:predicted ABC-type ATPase